MPAITTLDALSGYLLTTVDFESIADLDGKSLDLGQVSPTQALDSRDRQREC